MQRRTLMSSLLCLASAGPALAQPGTNRLAGVNETDATTGIRAALERGALAALASLGRPNGFLGNPKVRIPLPGYLESASRVLKLTGQQQRIDELVTAMNRAAESAVPEARTLLLDAVRNISVADARGILMGGDNSVTRFFAHTKSVHGLVAHIDTWRFEDVWLDQ